VLGMDDDREPDIRGQGEDPDLVSSVGPGETLELVISTHRRREGENLQCHHAGVGERLERGRRQLRRRCIHREVYPRGFGEVVPPEHHPVRTVTARVSDRHFEEGGDPSRGARLGLRRDRAPFGIRR